MADIAGLLARNRQRWDAAKFKPSSLALARKVATRLVAPSAKAVYVKLQGLTGVPWYAVAMIHEREASQKWDRSIAQGDRWDRRSTHVPKGRGPFKSFIDAAVDALVKCPPYAARWKDWTPGGMLTLQELYNGLGYANKGRPSPYVWSGTDQYKSGKYVSDGVYDPNTVDSQLGCAVMLKAMMEIDAGIYAPVAGIADIGGEVRDESADDGEEANPDEFPDAPDGSPPALAKENTPPVAGAPGATTAANIDAPAPVVVNEKLSTEANRPVIVSTLPVDEKVRAVQTQLRTKGFYAVGMADGKLGEDTKDAIMAFRRRNGLPVSTDIDDELMAALAISDKKPVSEIRAAGSAETVAQVAPEVVPVKQNFIVTAWGAVATFVAAAYNALSEHVASAWNFFTDHKDSLPTDSGFMKTAWGYVQSVPATAWIILGGAGLVLIAINSRRAVTKINESVQTGARQ